jgi:hypothetical protein
MIENKNQGLSFIGLLCSRVLNSTCILDESSTSVIDQICGCRRCQLNQIRESLTFSIPKIKEYLLFLLIFLSLWYVVISIGHAWKTLKLV